MKNGSERPKVEQRTLVRDNGDLHHYRTEIPNIIDEMKLSLIGYRLYGRLKRVAGDEGTCWQTTKTLAEACGMATGSVVKAKRELVALGLVVIEKGDFRKGVADTISIVDVWGKNFKTFHKRSPHERSGSRSDTTLVHQMNHTGSRSDTQEELLEEEPSEELAFGYNESTHPDTNGAHAQNPDTPTGKGKKEPDPRSKHPAIVAVRDVTQRFPSKDVWDSLIETLGDAPNIPNLKACFAAWRLKGYNPLNFTWATDWYKTGVPQNGNGYHKPDEEYNPLKPMKAAELGAKIWKEYHGRPQTG